MAHAILTAALVFFSLQLEQTTALGSSATGVVLLVLTPIASNYRVSGALQSLKQPKIVHFNLVLPDLN